MVQLVLSGALLTEINSLDHFSLLRRLVGQMHLRVSFVAKTAQHVRSRFLRRRLVRIARFSPNREPLSKMATSATMIAPIGSPSRMCQSRYPLRHRRLAAADMRTTPQSERCKRLQGADSAWSSTARMLGCCAMALSLNSFISLGSGAGFRHH